MKKTIFTLIAAILATTTLFVSGCGLFGDDDEDDNSNNESPKTTLVIKNMSQYALYIRTQSWAGVYEYRDVNIGGTMTIVNEQYGSAIESGLQYIYFTVKKDSRTLYCHVADPITIEEGQTYTFTFTNNTLVTENDYPANKNTLAAITPLQTTLTIKNDSTMTLSALVWGDIMLCDELASGASITSSVTAGSNYLYLNKYNADDKTNYTYFTDFITVTTYEEKTVTLADATSVTQKTDTDNTGTLLTIAPRKTTLTVINSSSYDLAEFTWQSVMFTSNPIDNVLEAGTSITQSINAGYGYIYFIIKDSGLMAKTNSVLSVNEYDSAEYEITDNTIVLEIYNESNKGALGTVEKQVVFYDDAEGALQTYDIMRAASYSSTTVYAGEKSIQIIGDSAGNLTTRITLEKNATLSFWYKNRNNGSNANCLFITNETEGSTNTYDFSTSNWSYKEYDLVAGSYTITFRIKSSYSDYCYLYLDNLKIVYTE